MVAAAAAAVVGATSSIINKPKLTMQLRQLPWRVAVSTTTPTTTTISTHFVATRSHIVSLSPPHDHWRCSSSSCLPPCLQCTSILTLLAKLPPSTARALSLSLSLTTGSLRPEAAAAAATSASVRVSQSVSEQSASRPVAVFRADFFRRQSLQQAQRRMLSPHERTWSFCFCAPNNGDLSPDSVDPLSRTTPTLLTPNLKKLFRIFSHIYIFPLQF